MKWGWRYLLYGAVIAGMLLLVVIIPELYFNILDRKIINVETQLPIEVMNMNNTEPEINLSLQDKIDMLKDSSGNIDRIDLKMGNTFSLYEARKQCFKELCKIPVLKMDLYGPSKDEIDISPILYIDTRTPSYAVVVWSGTVTIKGITFQIALEEENGKLIQFQYSDGNLGNVEQTKVQYEEAWKTYLDL
ncbi:MAG: hypothetical protein K0S04_945 [Herbinix sp.]|jgi:hypothetical protein|nr:hypothetical protein [Herbinix sp.]